MLIFKNNAVATVMVGDCLAALLTMPDRSINCCITSPPYYGLRDYGVDGQIGLEESPDAYVARLVEVFREVRRVLTDDGTLWLNIGDSYSRDPRKGGSGPNGKHDVIPDYGNARRIMSEKRGSSDGGVGRADRAPVRVGGEGLKPKDLIGIPWLLAFALRADGWYLRQDIIWNKPNPMPESVGDRCTKAHEYIFLLSKSERYFFDSEAMKEPADPANHRDSRGIRRTPDGQADHKGFANGRHYETRNKRDVWTVTPKPYKGAHFAVYPPELIEPCILAGCPEGGTVLDPFGGSGTTGGVALKHGRNAVLCELNGEYAALMPARIEAIAC